jgi:hypothetical protein
MPSIAPHFLPRASFPRRSVGILSRHSIRPDNDPRGVLWSRGGPSRGLAAEVERTIAAKATGETYRSLELCIFISVILHGERVTKKAIVMLSRTRVKHEISFGQRLANEAQRAREMAVTLPPGKKRDALLEKARLADLAARINGWLASPELKSQQ